MSNFIIQLADDHERSGLSDLIEALGIFLKYQDPDSPTHCEHDILCVMDITYDEVSDEDKKRLEELHFTWHGGAAGEPGWASYYFGSA